MGSSASIVTETVVSLLKTIPPFQFLPVPELTRLTRDMTLEYFPKDTVIISAGRQPSSALYIVHKGGVKLALRTQVGKELTLDKRSEGEIFGLLSLMGRDVARLDVTAIEDTLCYSIPAETMQDLMERHPDVREFLIRASFMRYMDRSLNELREQTHLMGDAERLLYSLAVKDVVSKPVLLCDQGVTIREAARSMAKANTSCIVVACPDGRPTGIVTDTDFTARVVAHGVSPDLPVTQIMSAPVITVESTARIFQALLAMLSRDIQHVIVTEDGLPKTVLTSHELMLLQGKSPLSVARHMEQQQTIEGLATAQNKIKDLLPLLLREGAKASHITRVVAEISDRLMTKILELAHVKLGPAPVPYCWVVLGSEGRREQTFKTDQDNALIFANVPEENVGPTRAYFNEFAAFVRQGLESCGYPPCPGDYMPTNPRWRQPLGVWESYFRSWITEAELHATQDALIFFDMRPVAGDFALFQSLAASFRNLLPEAGFFKSVLASISIEHKPPLGFFRTFVVERSGEHKEELDLKMFGTSPIVNATRLFALDAGIEATNTLDRLAALRPLGYLEENLLKDLEESFEFLTVLRLEHQLRQSHAGEPLSNHIRPESLTQLQRSLLRETFHTIQRMQSFLDGKFRTAVWSQLGH